MEKLISRYNVLLEQYNDIIINAFDDKDFLSIRKTCLRHTAVVSKEIHFL